MARETLTAEKNIEAAVSLLDTDGLDGFNMRTLGPSGVSAVKDSYEVAWIAAAVLDDIDPPEGDAAWRAYTTRPDAPAKYKDMPKPARRLDSSAGRASLPPEPGVMPS